MIGLFGVLTAAALTCTSMQQGCVVSMETRAEADLTIPKEVVPIPRAKPLRNSVAKPNNSRHALKVQASKSEPTKRKVKVVLQDNVKRTKRKAILLIGNYY